MQVRVVGAQERARVLDAARDPQHRQHEVHCAPGGGIDVLQAERLARLQQEPGSQEAADLLRAERWVVTQGSGWVQGAL